MEKKFIVTKSQLKRLVQKGLAEDIDAEFNKENQARYYMQVMDMSNKVNALYRIWLNYGVVSLPKSTMAICKILAKKYKGKIQKDGEHIELVLPLSAPKLSGKNFKTSKELESYVNGL